MLKVKFVSKLFIIIMSFTISFVPINFAKADTDQAIDQKNQKIKALFSQEELAETEVKQTESEIKQLEQKCHLLADQNNQLVQAILHQDQEVNHLNEKIVKRKSQLDLEARTLQTGGFQKTFLSALFNVKSFSEMCEVAMALTKVYSSEKGILQQQRLDQEKVKKDRADNQSKALQIQKNQQELMKSQARSRKRKEDLKIAKINLAVERSQAEGERNNLLAQKAEEIRQAQERALAEKKAAEEQKAREEEAKRVAEEATKRSSELAVAKQTLDQVKPEEKPVAVMQPTPSVHLDQSSSSPASSTTDSVGKVVASADKKSEPLKKTGSVVSGSAMIWDVDHGWYWGQCTWYASKYFGFRVPPKWGNALTWSSSAKADGRRVSVLPEAGTIVCYQPYVDGSGDFGHVAVVMKVHDDGSYDITESNALGIGVISWRYHLQPKPGVEFIYL